MLNLLWGAMLLIGIVYGAATGRMNEVTDAALSSAKEAVSLCITMAGIVAMWVGIMEIAKSSGLVERLTRKMRPLLGFLFPDVPGEHRAMEFISANMIANFLGLGWAATPFGLKAMEELAKLEADLKYQEGFLQSVLKKLSNEKFVSKAPAAKIEEEKAKLEKYTQMMAQVQERLTQLNP